jgi:hypothetical protein
VSKSIFQLGTAVAVAWPKSYPVDGTVASKAHDKRSPGSDHRPHPFTGQGIVRAIDIGIGSQSEGVLLFDQLVGDPRVDFVRFDLPDDPDPDHRTHVHVSMKASSDGDERKWFVITQHEVETLKRMVSGLDRVDSDGSFVEYAVGAIRRERDAGGYASKAHSHGGGSGGIQSGDTVKVTKV